MMMALPGKQQQMGLLFREERRTIDGVIEWRGVSLIYRPPLRPWLWSHLVHLLRNIEPSSVALERIFSLEVKQFYASMNPLIVTKNGNVVPFFSPYKIGPTCNYRGGIFFIITTTREFYFLLHLPLSLTLSKVIVVMATDTGAWDFYDRNQSRGDRMAALLRLPDIQLSSEIRCGVSTHHTHTLQLVWCDDVARERNCQGGAPKLVVICFYFPFFFREIAFSGVCRIFT